MIKFAPVPSRRSHRLLIGAAMGALVLAQAYLTMPPAGSGPSRIGSFQVRLKADATQPFAARPIGTQQAAQGATLSSQASSVRMIADEGEGGQYWPRWRGPSGQGLASGSGYPDTWSATQNVQWKT